MQVRHYGGWGVGLVRGVVLLLYEVSCFFLIRHHHDSCPYLDTQPNTARPGAVVFCCGLTTCVVPNLLVVPGMMASMSAGQHC